MRGRRAERRDALLAEWEFFGGPTGEITMAGFALRMGMTLVAWDRAFHRARAAGDERAVRPACEHPARFTRAQVLAEWERLGGPHGAISHVPFAARMGMSYTAWKSMYYRAQRARDPRALVNA